MLRLLVGATLGMGFTGRILAGMTVVWAPGLQLLGTTVPSLSSLSERMWNGLLLHVWH